MKNALLVLLSVILLVSCSKQSPENSVVKAPEISKKLVKWVDSYSDGSVESMSYVYDPSGKITTIKEDDRVYNFNFASKSSLVVEQKKASDNSLVRTIECTLNQDGYITKMLFKDLSGVITYTYTYVYDGNGYVSKLRGESKSSNFEEEYTITGGNMVSSKAYFDGKFTYNRYYTYDASIANKASFEYAGYWTACGLFGKSSKNLMIENKEFDLSNVLKWHLKRGYGLDAFGYPTKMTTTNMLNNSKTETVLSFQ